MKIALFDLDNTLFDRASAFRAWAEWWVESVGLGQAEVEWFCEMDEDGNADRRSVWISAKSKFGLPEPVDDLLASQRSAYLDRCTPDDSVLEALVSLRLSGWRIGVVTNGEMPHQAQKADRLGLLSVVDAFCGSGELGVEKPDPRIFDEAIKRSTRAKLLIGKLAGWLEMRPFPTSRGDERSDCARSGSTGDANGTPAMGIPRTSWWALWWMLSKRSCPIRGRRLRSQACPRSPDLREPNRSASVGAEKERSLGNDRAVARTK